MILSIAQLTSMTLEPMIVPPKRLSICLVECSLHGRRLMMKRVERFPADLVIRVWRLATQSFAENDPDKPTLSTAGRIERRRHAPAGFCRDVRQRALHLDRLVCHRDDRERPSGLDLGRAPHLRCSRRQRYYLPAYCCGLVVHSVGFYWIYGTIADFGGFGLVVSALIFALYVASGAIQFSVFAFIHHNLGPKLDAYCLRSPIAIVVSELVTIRVFHWHFGHTQIAFTPFVQIAGIGGAMLVSFVMFWLAEAGVRMIVSREWRPVFLLPVAALRALARLWRFDDRRLRDPIRAKNKRSYSFRAHRHLQRSATSTRSGKISPVCTISAARRPTRGL